MQSNNRRGIIIGKPAPDFNLQDHTGGFVVFKETIKVLPAMLVFYPGDFTPVCTSQLCEYRDNIDEFNAFGIRIFGISPNDVNSHANFVSEHSFPFVLLSDINNKVARQYGCNSLFMLGKVSRAVFLVNTKGIIIYRYVEPTILTRRKSSELIQVMHQLRDNNLL